MSLGWIDDYELLRPLGQGGMGQVFVARHRELGREVALKRLAREDLGDVQLAERLLVEAQAVAKLRHPGLVAVHAVGQVDGAPYFVMDLVEGRPLGERLREGPLDGAEAARLTLKLAEALAHAHAQGVIHRDLKPDNVLLQDDGQPVLIDFGLARELSERREALTRTGELAGTPAYMAPEQARGERDAVGVATDVYGLGATLYALLTGHAPFSGGNVLVVLAAVSEDAPKPPSRLVPVDSGLERICLRCLEKRPTDRYGSMQALADDLRRYLEGGAVGAGRGRALSVALAALGVVVVVGSFIGFGVADPPTPEPPTPEPTPTQTPPLGDGPAESRAPQGDPKPKAVIELQRLATFHHEGLMAARFAKGGILTAGWSGLLLHEDTGAALPQPLEGKNPTCLDVFAGGVRYVVGGNGWFEVRSLGDQGGTGFAGLVNGKADRVLTWGSQRLVVLRLDDRLNAYDSSRAESDWECDVDEIEAVQFTPNGDLAAVDTYLGLHLWRWGTWERQTWKLEQIDRAHSLTVLSDHWWVGDNSGRVTRFDRNLARQLSLDGGVAPRDYAPRTDKRAHESTLRQVAVLSDGRIVTVSKHELAVWAADGALLAREKVCKPNYEVWDADVSPQGDRVVLSVKDRRAELWSISR